MDLQILPRRNSDAHFTRGEPWEAQYRPGYDLLQSQNPAVSHTCKGRRHVAITTFGPRRCRQRTGFQAMTFARPKFRAQGCSGTPPWSKSCRAQRSEPSRLPTTLSTTGSRPNLQNVVYAGVAAHQPAATPVVPLARIFFPEEQPRHARSASRQARHAPELTSLISNSEIGQDAMTDKTTVPPRPDGFETFADAKKRRAQKIRILRQGDKDQQRLADKIGAVPEGEPLRVRSVRRLPAFVPATPLPTNQPSLGRATALDPSVSRSRRLSTSLGRTDERGTESPWRNDRQAVGAFQPAPAHRYGWHRYFAQPPGQQHHRVATPPLHADRRREHAAAARGY